MPATIAHDASPTTRPPAWRWLIAVVAFVAYVMAGMHVACADDCAGSIGTPGLFSSGGDDAGKSQVNAHCHAAHLQAEAATEAEMSPPAMRASRVGVTRDALRPSAKRPRLEDPPRS